MFKHATKSRKELELMVEYYRRQYSVHQPSAFRSPSSRAVCNRANEKIEQCLKLLDETPA
jgi:hypothetical protein